MKSRNETILLVLIIGAALWAAFVFLRPKDHEQRLPVENTNTEETLPNVEKDSSPAVLTSTTPNPAASAGPVSFGPHLKEIGQCLGISNSLNDNASPNFADLQSSLQSALGELNDVTTEWKNIELQTSSGEKRRIRLEIEGGEEGDLHRRLQYYATDAEGNPVPLPVPPEQEINPTDTFLTGLESDGEVTLREEAHRGYYAPGAEMYYTERNGSLFELELNYQGKSVRCQDLDKPQGSCACF